MEHSFFSSKSNQTLGAIALVALIVALSTYAFYTMKQSKYLYTGPITISVVGQGEVTAVPDIGQFNFSVTASGTDATKAQSASASAVNAILAYLKEKGVEEKDIKTDSYNVYQNYRNESKPCVGEMYCLPGDQVLDGFMASQNVTVKVRNLDSASDLIAGIGNLGATNISGLQFTIDDTSNLKTEARTKAIADAKEKAKALTKDLDVRIVKMTGYYEDNGMPYGYGMGADMMSAKAESVSPELPTGEDVVRSQVTITYMVR